MIAALKLDAEDIVRGGRLSPEATRLLRRYVEVTALGDRLMRDLLAAVEGEAKARKQRAAGGDERTTSRRPADDPLSVMFRKGQIEPQLYLAGREAQRLLQARAVAMGYRSSALVDVRVDGGSDAAKHAETVRLDLAARWGYLTGAIMADGRAGGSDGARRAVVEVLERVCGPAEMSLADIERAGDLGRRALLARRLRAGLSVAAVFFRIGRDAHRAQVAHAEVGDCDLGASS